MPRTLRPERYPIEFFELALQAWRSHAPLEVPCDSPSAAVGLRTKFYFFFRALDARSDEGPEPLARALASAQRLPPTAVHDPGWETRAASDLLAAAADIGFEINGSTLILVPKSQSKYAKIIRRALDAHRGTSAEDSVRRLNEILATPEPQPPEGETK